MSGQGLKRLAQKMLAVLDQQGMSDRSAVSDRLAASDLRGDLA
jgi:hypothetical protein